MTQYEKLNFVNGSPPALNAATLNHIENGIAAATEGVTAVEKTVKDNKTEVDTKLSGKLDNTADSVKTDNIANKAVTSDKIANSAITAMKLANSAVSGSNIAQNQINTNHLQSGAVTADKLAEDVTNQFSELKGDLGKLSEEINDLKQNGTGGCLLTTETITIGGNTGGDDTEETIPVTLLILDYTTLALNVGDSIQLACSVEPSNATNTTIVWESSNSNIVTVDNGLITAIKSGNATITAKSAENSSITASCSVKINSVAIGKQYFDEIGYAEQQYNKSGALTTLNKGYHLSIPYIENMIISTYQNTVWTKTYPPFLLETKEGYIVPTCENPESNVYKATLSGYENVNNVLINMFIITTFGAQKNVCYIERS